MWIRIFTISTIGYYNYSQWKYIFFNRKIKTFLGQINNYSMNLSNIYFLNIYISLIGLKLWVSVWMNNKYNL